MRKIIIAVAAVAGLGAASGAAAATYQVSETGTATAFCNTGSCTNLLQYFPNASATASPFTLTAVFSTNIGPSFPSGALDIVSDNNNPIQSISVTYAGGTFTLAPPTTSGVTLNGSILAASGAGFSSAGNIGFLLHHLGGGFNGFNPVAISGCSDCSNPSGGIDILAASGAVDGTVTFRATGFTISAVPEPATWVTMILGFGLVGFSLRRQARALRTA